MTKDAVVRCGWCSNDPEYQKYHDTEWGVICRDRQQLFETLCLESQQAGLSWLTVLRKRANYRTHFFQHPIEQIAVFDDEKLASMRLDVGLIRHQGKIKSIQQNAAAWILMEKQGVDMVDFLWDFVGKKTKQTFLQDYKLGQPYTTQSQKMSKVLKSNGFKFLGPTICYSFMQACGMVNDHEVACFRCIELQ